MKVEDIERMYCRYVWKDLDAEIAKENEDG